MSILKFRKYFQQTFRKEFKLLTYVYVAQTGCVHNDLSTYCDTMWINFDIVKSFVYLEQRKHKTTIWLFENFTTLVRGIDDSRRWHELSCTSIQVSVESTLGRVATVTSWIVFFSIFNILNWEPKIEDKYRPLHVRSTNIQYRKTNVVISTLMKLLIGFRKEKISYLRLDGGRNNTPVCQNWFSAMSFD